MASSLPPGFDPTMIPSSPPPHGVIPNFVNPVTLADPIVAVSATVSTLAFILLLIRLYSTLRITRSASYDDGMIILAMLCSLGYVGLIVHTKDDARHGWDQPISAYTASYFKIIFSETIVAALGFLFAKNSILFLLFRVFSPTRTYRYMIYGGVVWATIISLTSVVVAGALCAPRSGESFGSMAVAKRCTHEDIWAVVQGSLTVVLDFYILYLPIPIVWKLQMGLKKRIGVIAIFMTGFIACVASILSLAFKVELATSSDTLWNSGRVDILNIFELNTAIMVACMPACAAFSRHFLTKYGVLSTIQSRFSTSKEGPSKTSKSSATATTASNDSSGPVGTAPVRTDGRYWSVDYSSMQPRGGDRPPQILPNKRQSRFLQSGDLDVFEDEGSPHRSSVGSEQTAVEAGGPMFDKEDCEPNDIV